MPKIAAYSRYSKGGNGELAARVVVLEWNRGGRKEFSSHLQIRGIAPNNFARGNYFVSASGALSDARARARDYHSQYPPKNPSHIPLFSNGELIRIARWAKERDREMDRESARDRKARRGCR